MSAVSPWQFALFRVLFGLYLTVHFAMLVPYAGEVFGPAGMVPDPGLFPTHGVLPNLLAHLDGSGPAVFVGALAALALLFTVGVARPLVAVLLWYGWACLLDRNLFVNNPGIPYVGWILLACALVPEGEPLSLRPLRATTFSFPRPLAVGVFWLLMVGYSVSGLHKLTAPSWQDGTAFRHVLEIPLARDTGLRELLLGLPSGVHAALTWSALALEIAAAPLCLVPALRRWVWLALVGLQLGILSLVAFADLTLGMIAVHLFAFDGRWLRPRQVNGEPPIVFFDGVCGLCNKAVDVILQSDAAAVFRFAPLQGETASARLPAELTRDPDTFVLLEGGRVSVRSDAAIGVATALGGMGCLAAAARWLPRPVRDALYGFVARNRYRWFGKRDTCRLPAPEERARFLP